MREFQIGDRVRMFQHCGCPEMFCVLDIEPCDNKGHSDHPMFLINDPETSQDEWVCSLDFELVKL